MSELDDQRNLGQTTFPPIKIELPGIRAGKTKQMEAEAASRETIASYSEKKAKAFFERLGENKQDFRTILQETIKCACISWLIRGEFIGIKKTRKEQEATGASGTPEARTRGALWEDLPLGVPHSRDDRYLPHLGIWQRRRDTLGQAAPGARTAMEVNQALEQSACGWTFAYYDTDGVARYSHPNGSLMRVMFLPGEAQFEIVKKGLPTRKPAGGSAFDENERAAAAKLIEISTNERNTILAEFKNFHRLICEAANAYHDEIHWRRDQASLAEAVRIHRINASGKAQS